MWHNGLMKTIIQFMVTKDRGVYTADGVNVPAVTETENYAIHRKPDLCRSKRCPAVGGVRVGLFERTARGARPSVYRLLESYRRYLGIRTMRGEGVIARACGWRGRSLAHWQSAGRTEQCGPS